MVHGKVGGSLGGQVLVMGCKVLARLFQEGEELPELAGRGFHAGPSAGTHLLLGCWGNWVDGGSFVP